MRQKPVIAAAAAFTMRAGMQAPLQYLAI